MLVRMLPAIGPDSTCRDYGDAPRGGMHKVFDIALADIDTLLIRTRSLIVIDWRFNREIHGVLRKLFDGCAGFPIIRKGFLSTKPRRHGGKK